MSLVSAGRLAILVGVALSVGVVGGLASSASRASLAVNTSVRHAVLSPDGKLDARPSDRDVPIWDGRTGRHLQILRTRSRPVNDGVFSPDGKLVATAQFTSGKIWRVASGRLVHTLTGHRNTVLDVAFSPDGKRVLTSSLDDTVRMWDVATGRMLHVLRPHGFIWAVEFSPDGKLVVTAGGSGGARIWDADDGHQVRLVTRGTGLGEGQPGYEPGVQDASFSVDGTRLVTAYSPQLFPERGLIAVWDVKSGRSLGILRTGAPVSEVAFSSDGKLLVAQDYAGRVAPELWDVASARKLRTFTGRWAVLNPDGTFVATSVSSALQLWEVATGRKGRSFPGYGGVFSPDGALVATVDGETAQSPDGAVSLKRLGKSVQLWDVARGTRLHTLTGHTAEVRSTTFSANGKLLLSWSGDGTARIWDVTSGSLLHTLS